MKKKVDKPMTVVITGLGVVSSLGIGWRDFWKNLLLGKSGISRAENFILEGAARLYAGEIKNFNPIDFFPTAKAKAMGRASQFAVIATKLALRDAKLSLYDLRANRAGACIGTTMGEPQVLEAMDDSQHVEGLTGVNPQFTNTYPSHAINFHVAKEFRLKGPNYLFANACAAGNYSIGYAFDLIRSGEADIMLAGGVDAMTRLNLTGFSRLLAVAPEKCQPFDKNRKGMLVGEGCGILVLETLERALKRKATIYAEVLGYGLSCDAKHMTAPTEKGMANAMKKALKNSGITPSQVSYISAHGTGTKENDRSECSAIKKVFGTYAKKIPVSSIKSMLGHSMGAAAALEAIACCLAIQDSKIPPTINFRTPDPECAIDCVPNKARDCQVMVAVNNSSAFGGNNAALVFKRVDINK